ncbi:MAG: hypothetical protein ABFD64_08530 [Armatimonadota bacterium]
MQWLQDKKNLPFVIGGVVLVVVAVVVFLFMQMSGSNNAPTDNQSTAGGAAAPATAPAAGAQSPNAALPGGPAGATAAAPSSQVGGTAPSTPGVPGTQMASAAGENAKTPACSAAERWRVDPFAPQKSGSRIKEPKPRLAIPLVSRLFPPAPVPPARIKRYKPQPPRRVAGILYGDKVNALIQTPDGWEIKRPGERLSDGTIVEKIERDRVILRTVNSDGETSFVEVKLAASLSQLNSPASRSNSGSLSQGSGVGRVPSGGRSRPAEIPGL